MKVPSLQSNANADARRRKRGCSRSLAKGKISKNIQEIVVERKPNLHGLREIEILEVAQEQVRERDALNDIHKRYLSNK